MLRMAIGLVVGVLVTVPLSLIFGSPVDMGFVERTPFVLIPIIVFSVIAYPGLSDIEERRRRAK